MKRPSRLAIGRAGRYCGVAFAIRGHLRLRHSSGGEWDEWFAAFEDGRGGWIAEAGGHFLVTFEDGSWLPTWRALAEGKEALPAFVVVEKGRARFASARGKLPFRPKIGKEYAYADLRGPSGAFATIDYGDDPPNLFVGREVSLKELSLVDAPTQDGGK
jgi:hypothetical protein